MAIVSDIEIRLMANIARLQQDMEQARRTVTNATDQIGKAAGIAGKALGALGVGLSFSAFAGFVKGAIDSTDALNDLSVRTKISIEDLSGLAYAAKISDSSLDGIAGSVSKLATNIGKDTDKFRRLGVTAEEPLEAFKQLADIFKAIQDPQQRAAFGAEALGKSWQESAVLLNEGGAGIDALIKKGQELAGVTTETATRAGEFNDKLDDLGFMVQGAGQRLASDLLPMLNLLVDDLTSTAKGATDMQNSFSPVVETFRALVIFGGNVAFTFKAVGTEIGVIAAQIGQYYSALGQLLTLDPKGAWSTLKGAFGTGGIGDMAAADAEKARAAFETWQDGWLKVGTAAAKVREEASDPFPDPFGIDAKFEQEAAARAAAFVKDSENQAKAKKAADEAAATAKKQADAYRDLTGAINLKLVESYREATGQTALTEGQKIALEIEQKIIDGKLALNAAQRAGVTTVLDAIDANMAAVESQKAYKKMQDEIEKTTLAEAKARRAVIDAAEAEADANVELVATFGMTKTAIAELEVARLEEQLAQRVSTAMVWDDIKALEELIIQKKRSAAAIANVEDLEQQRTLWTSIEKTAHDTFVSIANGGKDTATRLKETFKNVFFDWLYQQTLKKWIINLSGTASLSTSSGFASAAGMGGSGSSAFDLISIGKKIYDGFSTGFSSVGAGLGTYVTQLGNLFGSSSVSAFGAGMGLTGSQAASAAAAYNGAGMTSVGSSLSAGSAVGSAAGVAAGVAGGVYGGRLISGGYSAFGGSGNSAVNTGTAVGAAIGSIVPFIGTALGALVGGVIGGAVNRLFGHKAKEIVKQGITGNFTAEGFGGGENYAEWIKKGGLFRSDKKGTDVSPLSAEMSKALTDGFAAVRDATLGFADTFGVSADVIDGYSKKINLALTDDAAKNQEALTGLFTSIGDELATRVVPNIGMFIQEGETASATLQRLAADYQIVDGMLTTFGITSQQAFGALGVASIEARERLLLLTGGVEAFATQVNYFADNFLTQAEQIAPLQKAVNEQLAALGYTGVTTSDQFKDAVLGLASSGALATESGAKTYAGLLALAPAFKQVADYLAQVETAAKDAAEAEKQLAMEREAAAVKMLQDVAGAALSALGRSIDAQKGAVQSAFDELIKGIETRIARATDRITDLSGLSSLLKGANVAGVSEMQATAQRDQGRAAIEAALAIARAGGGLPKADDLRDAIASATADASNQYSSLVDYQRDQLRTANNIEALSGITDKELTVAQRTLLALQDQKTAAQSALSAELGRLDGLLSTAQRQLDAINGVDVSVLSLSESFKTFSAAIAAALKNQSIAAQPSVTNATRVEALYNSLLGRASDAAGLQFYLDRLREGASLSTIEQSIRDSAEYAALHGSGRGKMTSDTSAVVAELQTLNARMQNVEAATMDTAGSTGRLQTQFNTVSGGGNALATVGV